MINLDQVRTLEWKVKQAVQLIVQLRRENDMLRGRLSDTEVRLQELEAMVETFKVTQSQMESGIRSALDELDHLDASPVDLPPQTEVETAEPQAEVREPQIALEPEPALEPTLDESETAFEEEYAALVAAEAASLDDPVPEPESAAEALPEPASETAGAEVSPTPTQAPAAEDDRGQPGLGIF